MNPSLPFSPPFSPLVLSTLEHFQSHNDAGFPVLLYDIHMCSCLGLRAMWVSSPQHCPSSPWVLLLCFQVFTSPSKALGKCYQWCWKLVCYRRTYLSGTGFRKHLPYFSCIYLCPTVNLLILRMSLFGSYKLQIAMVVLVNRKETLPWAKDKTRHRVKNELCLWHHGKV